MYSEANSVLIKPMRRLANVILPVLMLVFITACSSGLAGEPDVVATLPPRPTPTPAFFEMPENIDIATGEKIFAQRCAACHGVGGAGDGEAAAQLPIRPMNFTDAQAVSGKTPQGWFQIIYFGRQENLMPAFGVPSQVSPTAPLNADEIWAVTMYLFTLSQTAQATSIQTPDVALLEPITTPDPDAPAETTPEAVIAQANAGIVTGIVSNGTSGGEVPPELPVLLYRATASGNQFVAETTLNADGTFQFDDVVMSHGQEFFVAVGYSGGFFRSPSNTPLSGENTLELPITIYDTTYDPQAIQVRNILTYANVRNDELDIVQIVDFVNVSDKVYVQVVDDRDAGLMFGLPEGATFIDVTNGRFRLSEDGRTVIDSLPVFPQSTGVSVPSAHFAFTMPYDGDVTLEQVFPYLVQGELEILLQQQGIRVDGDGFQSRGSRMIQAGIFSAYGATLAQMPQTPIRYSITGAVIAPVDITDPATGAPNLPLAIGLVVAGALSIGVAGWIYIKDRRAMTQSKADTQTRMNALVKEIASLDIAHKEGKLDDKAYKKQRDKLKAELTQLMKDQKDA